MRLTRIFVLLSRTIVNDEAASCGVWRPIIVFTVSLTHPVDPFSAQVGRQKAGNVHQYNW